METSEPEWQEMLQRDCEEAFDRLSTGLPHILKPRRRVPSCRFRLRDKNDFNARIRQPGHSEHLAIVEMNSGTLRTLHQTIADSSTAILAAIAPANESVIAPDLTLTSVYDVAVHFILLHELYHIYEGHLDFLSDSKGRRVLSEVERCFTGDDPGLDRETAYYLEMEADGSALVSLLTHVAFHSIVEQAAIIGPVEPAQTFVQELSDEPRLFGYRIILCAVWIVGALVEVNRPQDSHSALPLARMLSLVSTLMSWFIEADDLAVNEQGELIQRLNEHHPELIARFLNHVAKPVVVHLWQFPRSVSDTSNALFSSTVELEQFLRDIQSLIGRQPATSPATQQIIASEQLRIETEEQLARHRFFSIQ